MPKLQALTPSFNAGELSPRIHARVDFVKYPNGLEFLENMIPLSEGGVTRRSGLRYVAPLKSSSVKGRLKKFSFSNAQNYVLEFGALSMRFYKDQGRISVEDVSAAITNGDFATDITGWTDDSTGSATISHADIGEEEQGTNQFPTAGGYREFGDGFPDGLNMGLLFPNGYSGDVSSVILNIASVNVAFDAKAKIYTDSSGSPGAQVGGDSDTLTLNSTGANTFTWSSNAPALSDSTSYWVVFTDITAAGTGDIDLTVVVDQGVNYATGWHDTLTSITETSPTGPDIKVGVVINVGTSEKFLALNATGSDTAIASQTISSITADGEHVLKLRVYGLVGDSVKVRIGTVAAGTDVLDDRELQIGFHLVAFTPLNVSTVYLQFRNDSGKTVYVSEVEILDDVPLELKTSYAEADLFTIKGPQSADVLYLFHPDYAPRRLSRRGHTTWSLTEVLWQDGPYIPENTTATTLTAAAATGLGIVVTASSEEGINDGAGFKSTDVGRLIRITHPTTVNWGWGVIASVTSSTIVTVDIKRTFVTLAATARWTLGAWSETTGYPSAAGFYESRLVVANNSAYPQTLWHSQKAFSDGLGFEDFAPDSDPTTGTFAGTVEDDDAFDFTLSADDVNPVLWVSSGEDSLVAGTSGGEWTPSSTGAALSPSDVVYRRQTKHGSADIIPVRVDRALLFVQKAKRKILEFSVDDVSLAYEAFDMTRLAQHITKQGVVEMSFAEEPNSVVWAVRADGQVPAMTFRRKEDVVGWGRHIAGGSFGGGDAVVESVVVIPGANGAGQVQDSTTRDEVWMIVKRTINGATARYVEFLERDFESWEDQEDSYYLDSLFTYDGAETSTITGLDHLEGETVGVFADGAIQLDKTVSSGSITLDYAASTVQVGLRYKHKLRTLRLEGGNPAGTAVGKKKQIFGVTLVVLDSHTFTIISDSGASKSHDFREVGDPMDAGAPFFTGEKYVEFDDDWSTDSRITIESDDPCPFTLLALAPDTIVRATR